MNMCNFGKSFVLRELPPGIMSMNYSFKNQLYGYDVIVNITKIYLSCAIVMNY